MNQSTTISLPVAADLSALQHIAVKLTSTGINVATSVNDRVIGTCIHPNLPAAFGESVVGRAATVFLSSGNGLHFVQLGAGSTTAIAMGDELELDTTDGTYCLRTTGALAGIAVDIAPSSSAGGIIRAILFPMLSTGSRSVTLTTGATLTASQSGSIVFLNAAGGGAIVLPANTAGMRFEFICMTAPTTDWTITSVVADTIVGYPINVGGADSIADGNAAGDVLNFKANAALPSDRAVFTSDGTSWQVTATAAALHGITITG